MGLAGAEGILLGYENENTAYHILRLADSKVIITNNAAFDNSKFPSLSEVVDSSLLNLDNFTLMVDEASLDETEEDTNVSEMVDEIRINSLFQPSPSIMVDQVHVDGEAPLSSEEVNSPTTLACSKVIGPCHPTLVASDINNVNMLPYPRCQGDSMI
ncbi:hypothetical protein O181_015864 [Austropuccinia psidii MF-1]|uniref:Retroviral polymerase SH3-like domain-containing protein n=1 Tax=Austropuccinia psidii MF-1 TaxID=1389203 RepID=A0A9Q3C2S3_9BASI|nr:hypothetical protein [Austropuccinia psidii MF-1]